MEDERLNIELYKEMLESNYELDIAENGREAFSIMEQHPPDIVLLDVLLPDFNGIDLCRTIKSERNLLHIPVIVITALDSPADKINALEAGANDFLTKPVDKTELLLKIKNHLKILEQYKLIKKQNLEINQYMEVIIHRLKNPISVMTMLVDLMRLNFTDRTIHEYADKMDKNVKSMLDSITGILDTQKIMRSSFNIVLEEFNLVKRIEEISADWKLLARQKRIDIRLSLDTVASHAYGDTRRFKDVIDNLVSNAVKYSPFDTAIFIISSAISPEKIKVMVKDQGLGLTEADKKSAFTEFKKLSARPTGGESSSGLGLSIVRRMVELMGGEVGVESEGPGKGSTFWFTLQRPH